MVAPTTILADELRGPVATSPSPPLELVEVKQEDLHRLWDAIIQRGVLDIKRVQKPEWRPEDIYAALRNGLVNCVFARRAERLLGFLIYNRQQRPFSYRTELFVWLAWNLPIREWLPNDDMQAAVTGVWNYIANIAKTQYQTDQISWITNPSRAKAFTKRFGWRPTWVTMTAKV